MRLSSDQLIFWQYGAFKLNGTIVTTWLVMVLLVVGSRLVTWKLIADGASNVSRWQLGLEIVVTTIRDQIRQAGLDETDRYLGFLGTLFLFLATINLLTIVPFFDPPRDRFRRPPPSRFASSSPCRFTASGSRDLSVISNPT